MPQRFLSVLFIVSQTVICFAPEPPTATAKIESARWLSGTWEMQASGRTITEHWMPPAGGKMLGMSRTVASGRTVEYEFVLLREDEDGGLSYVAKPSGQAGATFKLIKVTSTELVFENPAHDFPKTIFYTVKNETNLVAAIEGRKNGKTRRIEFHYFKSP
jgi:hypothetical protein